jgi:O-acetyl-ADP-ribose deacetylase (regulator of RNase III)|tara:strand:+ start:789 stop:1289 length:501 start_codon:yes stop_codon:yes gene_type:complete
MNISVERSDITTLAVDVIVNAANRSLLGGGGVDGSIHRAAGPELLAACKDLKGCETGQAKITRGFKLPSKFVIHTVGPVWTGGEKNEASLLSSCYTRSLSLACDHELATIAFPAISTGAYGYPLMKATQIAVESVTNWQSVYPKNVIFCCFDNQTLNIYEEILQRN